MLTRSARAPILRLGARGARHRPNRSLLSASLIALATFVIVSVEAFRRDPDAGEEGAQSGSGGYSLVAESAHPIVADAGSPEGLASLSLQEDQRRALEGAPILPLRLHAGDDASCLNLFAPREPRIAGATRRLLDSGRFAFAASLGGGERERANPWLLLDLPQPDGAVPAIADATTLRYSLHKALGDEITLTGPSGPVRLRFVAALDDSIFQSELIISEKDFTAVFPNEAGYRMFLIDAPPERAPEVARALEEGLAANGLDVTPTRERLAAFHRVENTYISTFQALGGLGLVLGTIGVGTVLVRNVLERRAELALLRAVGYSRRALGWMVVAENVGLVVSGLAAGALGALVAVVPALQARAALPRLAPLALVLALVAVTALAASIAAAAAALRAPLLPALRNE